MAAESSRPLHVAAAVVKDRQGRVLIARRPPHVHQGDLWEFPGGKLEPGEDVQTALRRELWEELHIEPLSQRPLIRVPFQYSDRQVLLDVWQVDAFSGTAVGREGQPVRWVQPEQLPDFAFPAANLPIVTAARLPETYLITPDCRPGGEAEFLARLEASLRAGVRLVQLRVKSLPEPARLTLARAAVALAHAQGARLMINGNPEEALSAGADGAHLSSALLAQRLARPAVAGFWIAASCHSAAELVMARQQGLDFVVLSPVGPTTSHPEARPLGWVRFAELIRDLPMPVFALGGLSEKDLPAARAARAQGVAGISAFWGENRAY